MGAGTAPRQSPAPLRVVGSEMALPSSSNNLTPRSVRPGSYAVSGQLTNTAIFAFVMVASLYLARDILMPFALAVLLSFMLAPLVRRLQRWYVPRGLAVISVVIFAFGVIFILGSVMVSQVNQLASDLPRYQSTLREKIQSLRIAAGTTGTLERASEVLQNLNDELKRPNAQGGGSLTSGQTPPRPVPVEIREPNPGPLATIISLIRPLIQPLATMGLVLVFVIFILWQRQDLRNRLVRLAGSRDLQRTTKALNDAGQRLSRLFLRQLMLNSGFGLVVGLGWWVIGVPSAALWGIMVVILRFMPYIGTWISAIFPLLLAAAVGPDWNMVIWAGALFLVVELLVGQVIEPLVQGHSTGLSPVAVIASATFWTWLWGPIGLVLATPITMGLAVLGRHIESLKFLDVLFGDRPPLNPQELAYQRMLARDPIEVTEAAHSYLKAEPLMAYYQDILVGGLQLAQLDAARGMLDQEGRENIRHAVEEVLDDLHDHIDRPPVHSNSKDDEKPLAQLTKAETAANEKIDDLPERWSAEGAVVCVPGAGELDEALAMITAQLIGRRGIRRAGREGRGARCVADFCAGYEGNAAHLRLLSRGRERRPDPLHLAPPKPQGARRADRHQPDGRDRKSRRGRGSRRCGPRPLCEGIAAGDRRRDYGGGAPGHYRRRRERGRDNAERLFGLSSMISLSGKQNACCDPA